MPIISTSFPKLTVNGANLENGEDALKHVEKEFKPELERWLRLLDLEDNFVQDIPPSLRHAIFKNAPVYFLRPIILIMLHVKKFGKIRCKKSITLFIS